MNTLFALVLALLIALQPTVSTFFTVEVFANVRPSSAPVHVVGKMFNAYSKRNLHVFMSHFSENIEVSLFPNKLLFKGKSALEHSYMTFFQNTPALEVELLSQQTKDNRVIDEMLVTRRQGCKPAKTTVLYEVENGLIVRMCFL